MKKRVFAFLMLIFIGSFNQLAAQGINFQHLTLEEALQKAKAENKLVFIDFYTEWCGPCKILSKKVFPLPEVGKVYNEEYVSIKLDAEKEGIAAAKKYKVASYPTLLFLNSDGAVVYRDSGSQPVESFVELGRSAAASVTSEYSLEKLKTDFPNRQKDARFLKIYNEKMVAYGQDPSEGIEAWLKVQTEIKENSGDMIDFLLKNNKYFLLNSKGYEILEKNYNELMDIATKQEEKQLDILKVNIINNTREAAIKTGNGDLMQLYIDKWKQLPENYRKGSLTELELTKLSLQKNDKGYKELAIKYMDSIMNDKPISQIQKEDKEFYLRFKENYDKKPSQTGAKGLKGYEEGKITGRNIRLIDVLGHNFLKKAVDKSDYKTLEKWIKYGYELQPNSYFMDNLMADMYGQQGDTKKAIELKKKAVSKWPTDDKKYSSKAYELEQMQNNK